MCASLILSEFYVLSFFVCRDIRRNDLEVEHATILVNHRQQARQQMLPNGCGMIRVDFCSRAQQVRLGEAPHALYMHHLMKLAG